jgi:hypothetical protein
MIGRTDSSGLGQSTASAGDLDNDNNDEIISSAINEPAYYTGTVYIWLCGSRFDTIPDAWIRGNITSQGIGWHVASAGDIDGDTRDEIMVSNSASNFSQKKSGFVNI